MDLMPLPPKPASQSRKDRLLTRDDVEALIAEGRSVFIHNGRVLRVDPWVKFHPGGDKSIQHMIGRDATDEVNAYVQAKDKVGVIAESD